MEAVENLMVGEEASLQVVVDESLMQRVVDGDENLSRPPRRGGGPSGQRFLVCSIMMGGVLREALPSFGGVGGG